MPTEKSTVESFARTVTLPLLLDIDDKVTLQGTGTLFKIAGQHMVVTARHVFDDIPDLEKFAFPEAPKGGAIHTFGQSVVVKPTSPNIDVAVILLNDPATVERLSKAWQFLSLANIADPAVNAPDGHFFVAGYPVSMTKPVGGWLSGGFVTAYTQRIPDIPAEAELPVSAELDLFFDYRKTATVESGAEIATPKLPGVSGAAIWQAKEIDATAIWTPEAAFSIVGVQSSYLHSKYIRAKSWWAVAKLLEQTDANLAAAVRRELTI